MGNFEKAIPKNIATLEQEIKLKYAEIRSLDWGHDCDCEYCTERGVAPEDTEIRNTKLEADIKELKTMISRLKRHVVVNKVELV